MRGIKMQKGVTGIMVCLQGFRGVREAGEVDGCFATQKFGKISDFQ